MFSKRTSTSQQDLKYGATATEFVSRSWFERFAAEIAHRCRLALFAPTIQRSLAIERQRAQAEREKMAEEYARGYLDGWHECYSACLEAVEESVAEQRDVWAAGELLAGLGAFPRTN